MTGPECGECGRPLEPGLLRRLWRWLLDEIPLQRGRYAPPPEYVIHASDYLAYVAAVDRARKAKAAGDRAGIEAALADMDKITDRIEVRARG